MLPHSDIRLGAADIDGTHLGNPIELGVPATFVLILILSDRGQWLFLERRFWARVVLAVITAEWLILSGSRGSWLAALAAIGILMLLNRGDRRLIVVLVVGMVIVTGLALTTPLGEKIQAQYDKTLDSDRTLANRTSGRSAQWEAIPLAFAESPVWGWGPGTGRKVVAYYTGRTLNWHALYLHIAAETGSVGLTALFGLLIAIARRTIRTWRAFGEIAPMLAFIVYAFLGFSVSAFDANCGVLLGMAMLGADFAPRYQLVEATIRELEPAV
jgi:O-antigen ligase